MVIELELDFFLHVRFAAGRLPGALHAALGQHKRALHDALGPSPTYGDEAFYELAVGAQRFLLHVRAGQPRRGEDGRPIHPVRIIDIIANTAIDR